MYIKYIIDIQLSKQINENVVLSVGFIEISTANKKTFDDSVKT